MADYSGFKANELKELLKERGIPSTGLTRKQQYIDALEKQDGENAKEVSEGVEQAGGEQQHEPATASNGDINPSDDAATDGMTATESATAAEVVTPQVGSPTPEDGRDSRKRKRRSPTPAESAESLSKKLKAADEEELPRLAEDLQEKQLETEAPVPLDEPFEGTVQATGVSDDVVHLAKHDDVKDQDVQISASNAPVASDDQDTSMAGEEASAAETTMQPSTHSATSALYIRNLLRPLQVASLRNHLIQLATPPDAPVDESILVSLHLDNFRSHAFAVFTSVSTASCVRSQLHDRVWPDEVQRKPLFVDFIPEDKVEEWSAMEIDAGKARRFEVVYSALDSTDAVAATLEEVGVNGTPMNQPGPGMPNAPTGPRGDRRTSQSQPQRTTKATPAPRQSRPGPDTSVLETRFTSTAAQPKIFYLPVNSDLAAKRLDELDRESARDWDGGRQKKMNGPLDQLRRYTFEDDYLVVDGGPDFGGFGREQGAGGGGPPPPPPGGYGGRRGGGGNYGGGGGGRGRRW